MRTPIHTAIVELLAKNPSGLTDKEIYVKLREQYEELSFNQLMRILLKLEINGIVRVTRYQKETMKVELLT
ncbi:transcriptional repressor [Candidatus Bathyarchaeota archaeon]|nr:transcriptional repressor [Candidatus Bathyarchaeota archaeon]MBS7617780.1 transcriptional repressor [Candidatus Bathyarchaeota archaeon]